MEVIYYLGFFLGGLVIGCLLTIALEHGKDTIIAHWTKITVEKTKR